MLDACQASSRRHQMTNLFKNYSCIRLYLILQLRLRIRCPHTEWALDSVKEANGSNKKASEADTFESPLHCPLAVRHLKDNWENPSAFWASLKSRNYPSVTEWLQEWKEIENFLIARRCHWMHSSFASFPSFSSIAPLLGDEAEGN